MTWSEYFAVDSVGKIFSLFGILFGFFAGVFALSALLELLQIAISKTILTGCRNLRIRFTARVFFFWVTRLFGMGIAVLAAAVISFSDSPSAGGYVQINVFVFVGLFTTWRAIALWPEFARHVHCILEFASLKRAQFSSRHREDGSTSNTDEVWSLCDVDPHVFTYSISSPSHSHGLPKPGRGQTQQMLLPARKTTVEKIPISMFTSARYTIVHGSSK